MNAHSTLEQDLALKRFASAPKDQKPNFPWRDSVRDLSAPLPEVQVLCPQGPEPFDLGEIADTIGGSLATLLLARGESDIFTAANRQFVAAIAGEVATNLAALALQQRPLRLQLHDLYVLIEKTLVDNSAYDVAQSLLHIRSSKLGADRVSADTPLRLVRRNNQVVPWSETKVEIAVRKAFLALRRDPSPAAEVARAVTTRALATGQPFLHLEEVQDLVQEELMRLGHFKVAESFIIYRAMRAAVRATEQPAAAPVAPVQPSMVVVVRGPGDTYLWDGVDLKKRIEFALIGLDLPLTPEELELELRRPAFDHIAQTDLNAAIVNAARALAERDADFARFAARIHLTFLYEEALGWDIVRDGIGRLRELHQARFADYLRQAVALKAVHPRLLAAFAVDKLAAALDPAADLDLDFAAVQLLQERYLLADQWPGRPRRIETPQFFWMRVAMGHFLEEKTSRETWALALYGLLKDRRYLPSAATLAHAGTPRAQLCSSYLYYVDDSIEGVMQRGIADNAYLARYTDGLGGSWTSVRGAGAPVVGAATEAQGVVPFLRIHSDLLLALNHGSRRHDSGCAYLELWHSDIFDFLALRRPAADGRPAPHLNTAAWIPDLFMRRLEADEHWTLFHSSEVADLHHLYGAAFDARYTDYETLAGQGVIWGRRLPARDLWAALLRSLLETGHPWLAFKDACNLRSPQDHAGVIHSSNLTTEMALNTSAEETAVCAAGSVVLDAHLDAEGRLDAEAIRRTVRVAIRALDNVLDLNFYPTESARRAALRHRPVGLGVMGLAQALARRGEPFGSEAALAFGDEALEAIAHAALDASSTLATERGPYPSYKGSKWDRGLLPADTLDLLARERGVAVDTPRGGRLDWQPLRARLAHQGLRHSTLLALAPTPVTAVLAGTSPGVEPYARNLAVRATLSGEQVLVNPHLMRDLKARGLWDDALLDALKYFDGELAEIAGVPADLKEKYRTAFGLDPLWIVRAAARRQKWIDQSQAVALWLPRARTDADTLSALYRAAWRAGLKTTYQLHTEPAAALAAPAPVRAAAAPAP